MNLYLRLIWLTLTSRRRSAIGPLDPCVTPFRCWPTDLDVLRHMNNGKYFSIMDLARVDLMNRAGLAKGIAANGFYPVVVAETMRFKKSLQLFERFDVVTQVLGWDEKAFVLKQEFRRGDRAVAEAVVRARFLRKVGGTVSPAEILELAQIKDQSPALEPWIVEWNARQA